MASPSQKDSMTREDQVHIIDVYSIGDSFKGLTVKCKNLNAVKDTMTQKFSKDIIKIIPDQDIQFDLPKPQGRKRFYKRSQKHAERQGSFKHVGSFNNSYNLSKRASVDYVNQTNAQWNLVRISERIRTLSMPYIYDSNAGSNVFVYVVDDGMHIDHTEFKGRAQWGRSSYVGISRLGGGHGTHVAGIIGGDTFGVAKKTTLIAVQVLEENNGGSVSSLLAGIQWIAMDTKKHPNHSVVNMSLGIKTSDLSSSALSAFNDAVDALIFSGIPVFVAAGNWGSLDACDVSPASNKNVFAVAATDRNDRMTPFSSFGSCVQMLAPGDNISSAYIDSNTSTKVMSGTSMAAPHATGVAALLIGYLDHPTPLNIYKQMSRMATLGAISSVIGSTTNRLLFNGASPN
ncbi:unnamed protein product [Rhizopus stolonifer]